MGLGVVNLYDHDTSKKISITPSGSISGDIVVELPVKPGTIAYLADITAGIDAVTTTYSKSLLALDNAASILSSLGGATQATTYSMSQIDALLKGKYTKESCEVVATTAITLSGLQTIDNVLLVAGKRVLVTAQSDATSNGIYVVDSGTWVRASDAISGIDIQNSFVIIESGFINANSGWYCTADDIIIGTTPITYVQEFGGMLYVTQSMVTAAYLNSIYGYTPYNASNPSGFISGNQNITVTGDATGTGSTGIVLTLTNTAVVAGTYGDESHIPQITFDSKGRAIGVVNKSVSIPSGAITLIGGATGSGTTGSPITVTLQADGIATALGYTPVNPNNPTFTGTVVVPNAVNNNSPVTLGQITTFASSYALTSSVYNISQIDALLQGRNTKQAVKIVAVGNITLSGVQTIDGISTVAGDRVLVVGQTTGSANGIYVVSGNAWTRASDAATASGLQDAFVMVEQGTIYADSGWYCSTDNITLGTTPITFKQELGGNLYITQTAFTSSLITSTLGYTPYNATNPAGYINGITGSMVTTALGYTPYNASNPAGYLTTGTVGNAITSNIVTTALGFTPLGATAQAVDAAKLGGVTANGYALLASPVFTGSVTVPNAVANGNPVNLGQMNTFTNKFVAAPTDTNGIVTTPSPGALLTSFSGTQTGVITIKIPGLVTATAGSITNFGCMNILIGEDDTSGATTPNVYEFKLKAHMKTGVWQTCAVMNICTNATLVLPIRLTRTATDAYIEIGSLIAAGDSATSTWMNPWVFIDKVISYIVAGYTPTFVCTINNALLGTVATDVTTAMNPAIDGGSSTTVFA